mmetsp:Transcript_29269/g.76691  ORF Transcript_29269/g.76691 Transcript_29269/m.76691 type:complete len:254 (-) Transcript_29269:818-1579(-)
MSNVYATPWAVSNIPRPYAFLPSFCLTSSKYDTVGGRMLCPPTVRGHFGSVWTSGPSSTRWCPGSCRAPQSTSWSACPGRNTISRSFIAEKWSRTSRSFSGGTSGSGIVYVKVHPWCSTNTLYETLFSAGSLPTAAAAAAGAGAGAPSPSASARASPSGGDISFFSGAFGACWKQTQRPWPRMCTTSMLNGANTSECEHGTWVYSVLWSANPAQSASSGSAISSLTSYRLLLENCTHLSIVSYPRGHRWLGRR